MIADQDVVQLFRKIAGIPLGLTDSEIASKERQLFRGIAGYQWKDAHPMGCERHMAIFNRFNTIPKYCFDCYKVLITPRNVVELFKLLMIFEKIALPLDNTRKCMVEERDYCSGTYKGLVYCRGVNEGNEVHKIVRAVVSEDIAPQVSVTLKRGCSEFELAYPGFERAGSGSSIMRYRKDWKIHEDFYDSNFGFHPAILLNKNIPVVSADGRIIYGPKDILSMQYWLRYAATIGDMSYLTITGASMQPIPNLNRQPFKNTTTPTNK